MRRRRQLRPGVRVFIAMLFVAIMIVAGWKILVPDRRLLLPSAESDTGNDVAPVEMLDLDNPADRAKLLSPPLQDPDMPRQQLGVVHPDEVIVNLE